MSQEPEISPLKSVALGRCLVSGKPIWQNARGFPSKHLSGLRECAPGHHSRQRRERRSLGEGPRRTRKGWRRVHRRERRRRWCPLTKRKEPCLTNERPNSGVQNKHHHLLLTATCKSRGLLEALALKATKIHGKKGSGSKARWFQWLQTGTEPQRGRPGSFAIIERLKRRLGFGDRYFERVVDEETAQLLRLCDEPLSEHQGHGSAKRKP